MPLLLVLALGVFAGALSMRVIDPVVPEVARGLDTTTSTAALLASAFSFPYAFSQPLLGPLADSMGKARIIKIFLGVLTVAMLVSALAPSIEALFVARVVAGIAAGGVIPVAFAIVGDRFDLADRHLALSRIILAAVTGQLTSSIGAGFIAAAFGWRVALAITGFVALATLVASILYLSPRQKAQRPQFTSSGLRSAYATIFADPRAYICYGAVATEGLTVYGMAPYVATLLEAKGLGGIREAGIVIAGIGIGGVIYAALVRILLKVLGGKFNVMRGGGVIAASGFCLIALQPIWPLQFAGFVLVGLGFFMIHNVLQVQATELAPNARGSAIALHSFFFFLGQAAGPVAYGTGFSTLGVLMTVLLAAVIMLTMGFTSAGALQRLEARLPVRDS